MFQPASLKGGSPTPIDERIRNRYILIYIIIIVLSIFPGAIVEFLYFIFFLNPSYFWLFLFLFPLNFIIFYYILQLSAVFISKLFLSACNLIHRPKEGIFKRSLEDGDYFYWNIRNVIKKWPLYLMASNPFPWLKTRFILRFFGVKIGKESICDNAWISSEFVEIGENVIVGMSSSILTFGIEQKQFILKKIKINNDVIIGAKSVLMPGTLIKSKAKLSAHSYTNYDQVLEEGIIYEGQPAKST